MAHLLGSLAHSVGDVNFDRNFLTETARRQFGGDVSEAQKYTDIGIDFLAVFDHGRGFKIAGAWAPIDRLLEVFAMPPAIGVSANDLRRATAIHGLAQVGETLGSPFTYLYYKYKLGWAASNYYGARGGVDDTATLIARAWDLTWSALNEGRDGDIFHSVAGWPYVDFFVDGVELQQMRELAFGLTNRACESALGLRVLKAQ